MSETDVIKFLRCPASSIVELAIEMANLTWRESTAIDLVGRKAFTQEKSAEIADVSVDSIQKWYRKGVEKLCSAWNGVWWIEQLVIASK